MGFLSSIVFRFLCLIFVSFGLAIGRAIVNAWEEREEQRSLQQAKAQEYASVRRERRQRQRDTELREDQVCIICRENPREIVLLPCGHVCMCEDCSENIESNCPVCRAPIDNRNVAYIT